jgi:hypothetical protein
MNAWLTSVSCDCCKSLTRASECRDLGIRDDGTEDGLVTLQASTGRFLLLKLRNNVVALYWRNGAKSESFGGGTDLLRWARPFMLLCIFGFGAYKCVLAKANNVGSMGRYGPPVRSRRGDSRHHGHGSAFAENPLSIGQEQSQSHLNMYRSRPAGRGENSLDSMAGFY